MAKASVSPLTIRVMLACYASPEPENLFRCAEWESNSAISSRNWLKQNGLLEEDLSPTVKGGVWVDAICSVPLPVYAWIIPTTET